MNSALRSLHFSFPDYFDCPSPLYICDFKVSSQEEEEEDIPSAAVFD